MTPRHPLLRKKTSLACAETGCKGKNADQHRHSAEEHGCESMCVFLTERATIAVLRFGIADGG